MGQKRASNYALDATNMGNKHRHSSIFVFSLTMNKSSLEDFQQSRENQVGDAKEYKRSSKLLVRDSNATKKEEVEDFPSMYLVVNMEGKKWEMI